MKTKTWKVLIVLAAVVTMATVIDWVAEVAVPHPRRRRASKLRGNSGCSMPTETPSFLLMPPFKVPGSLITQARKETRSSSRSFPWVFPKFPVLDEPQQDG